MIVEHLTKTPSIKSNIAMRKFVRKGIGVCRSVASNNLNGLYGCVFDCAGSGSEHRITGSQFINESRNKLIW